MRGPGGPEVLEVREVPTPEPGPGAVRVRVRAVGVNRADLLQRRGRYPAPADSPQDILGLEYAGVVDEAGPGATRFRPGDRVMGIVGGGAYAEAVVVPESHLLPIPDGLGFEEAAAVPEAFITAHDALFTLMGLEAGERLLVHAAGSGVGVAAIQLAREAGAEVFGTARSPWKLDRALELGLDFGVVTEGDGFADAILERTGGDGMDAILDLVGGGYLADNLRVLAPKGRMAVVGLVSGSRAELDLGLLLRKRLTLIGTALRGRTKEEKAAATRAFADRALPLLAARRIHPVVDAVYPMHEAPEAHRRMESNLNFGKLVLSWDA